jgi:hypothetical protein
MTFRTDAHNNPVAFTTDIAKEASLVLGQDYEVGSPFNAGIHTYYTAKLLKDPVQTTIQVIDKIGFFTSRGLQRWIYIGVPKFLWDELSLSQKTAVIGYMYKHEGGTAMKKFFT